MKETTNKRNETLQSSDWMHTSGEIRIKLKVT
jgi:hypothetical protein